MPDETTDERAVKQPYAAPEVTDLGSVAELTQGAHITPHADFGGLSGP